MFTVFPAVTFVKRGNKSPIDKMFTNVCFMKMIFINGIGQMDVVWTAT